MKLFKIECYYCKEILTRKVKIKKAVCKKCSRKKAEIKRAGTRSEYLKNWRLENREKFVKSRNKAVNKYRKTQKGKNTRKAIEAERRACKLKASYTKFKKEIKKFYANCPKGYEVDHIIPLKNPKICGLHVPWNLQYLTPTENKKKLNKLLQES